MLYFKKLLDCIGGNSSGFSIVVPSGLGRNKDVTEGDNQICPEKTLWRRIGLLRKRKLLEVMQQHSKLDPFIDDEDILRVGGKDSKVSTSE